MNCVPALRRNIGRNTETGHFMSVQLLEDMERDGIGMDVIYGNTRNVGVHKNNCYELLYVCRGSVKHMINGKEYTVKPNQYCLIDFDILHRFFDRSEDYIGKICLFKPDYIDFSLRQSRSLRDVLYSPLINFHSLTPDSSIIFDDTDHHVEEEINRILEEVAEKSPGYLEYSRSCLLQIIIEAMRNIVRENEKSDPRIARAVAYVRENYAQEVNMSQLARELYLSQPNFCRIFKQQLGMTFTEFLQKTRIQAACRLLAEGTDPIETVAAKVGYEVRFFRKVFRKYTGTTPLQFRLKER